MTATINIKNLNGSAGYALPVDYADSDQTVNDPLFKGRGFGVDLGVVYVKKKRIDSERWDRLCGQEFDDYVYRIGVSILDVGNLTYKNNAELHEYDNVSAYWQNYDTTSFTSIDQITSDLSYLFYGDADASFAGNKIKIGLPTAVSCTGRLQYL